MQNQIRLTDAQLLLYDSCKKVNKRNKIKFKKRILLKKEYLKYDGNRFVLAFTLNVSIDTHFNKKKRILFDI